MRFPWVLLVSLLGCTSTDDSEPGDGDADTDVDSDTDTDADTAPDGDEVTVTYAGTVVTVAGTPFGLDGTVRTAPITGTFTYDPDVVDDNADEMRAHWVHRANGGFTFSVGTLSITGSGAPITELELYSDTWRFMDGATYSDELTDRTLQVDGVDAADAEVWLSITGSDVDWLADDAPLAAWPTIDITEMSHTFSVEDAGGTLLIQLDTVQ